MGFITLKTLNHKALQVRRWRLIKVIALVLIGFNATFVQAETVTDIYNTQYIPAQQLQRNIEQLYPDAKISSQGTNLIIRTEKLQLKEIQELLAVLDKPNRQFILQFSSSPSTGQSTTVSTNSKVTDNKQFTLSDGKTLTIDYRIEQQQLSHIGLLHQSLDLVENHKDSISITINSISKNRISIDYSLYYLTNGKREKSQSSSEITINDWVALSGEPTRSSSHQNLKHYGDKNNTIYLKVSEQ